MPNKYYPTFISEDKALLQIENNNKKTKNPYCWFVLPSECLQNAKLLIKHDFQLFCNNEMNLESQKHDNNDTFMYEKGDKTEFTQNITQTQEINKNSIENSNNNSNNSIEKESQLLNDNHTKLNLKPLNNDLNNTNSLIVITLCIVLISLSMKRIFDAFLSLHSDITTIAMHVIELLVISVIIFYIFKQKNINLNDLSMKNSKQQNKLRKKSN